MYKECSALSRQLYLERHDMNHVPASCHKEKKKMNPHSRQYYKQSLYHLASVMSKIHMKLPGLSKRQTQHNNNNKTPELQDSTPIKMFNKTDEKLESDQVHKINKTEGWALWQDSEAARWDSHIPHWRDQPLILMQISAKKKNPYKMD